MNSKQIAPSNLFLDRPLSNSVSTAKQNAAGNYRLLLDFANDRRAASFDSLLQILLAACLLSSLAVCGWNLGNLSGFDSTAKGASQQAEAAVAPASPAKAAGSVVNVSHLPTMPRACSALTVRARLF